MFVILGSLCALARPAVAESPDVALSADGSRLTISNLPPTSTTPIELASDGCLSITWTPGDAKQGDLPLILLPGAADPIAVRVLNQSRSIAIDHRDVPQVQVDPAAYEKLADWQPTSSPADRQTTLLLAVAMGTTLLLASLSRRGTTLSVGVVAIAWVVGLAVGGSHRTTLVERDDPDGTRWFLAVEAQTVRVPIEQGASVVPIVESMEHLRVLAPRVRVDGRVATLEVVLPRGAKVGIRKSSV